MGSKDKKAPWRADGRWRRSGIDDRDMIRPPQMKAAPAAARSPTAGGGAVKKEELKATPTAAARSQPARSRKAGARVTKEAEKKVTPPAARPPHARTPKHGAKKESRDPDSARSSGGGGATIHCVGKPETESEAKAIRSLATALSSDHHIIHNFELCSKPGQLAFEYDMVLLGKYAVYHVEVKGYSGLIRGNKNKWIFENGHSFPSPIPLANKKSKILASRLRQHDKGLSRVFVDTVVLLTDEKAQIRIKDDQASRVIQVGPRGTRRLTDPAKLPVKKECITPLHDRIIEAILGSNPTPSKKIKQIGLYNVLERISQYESHTVFLASHRYIRTRPKTILKVFHYDLYASEDARERQLQAIFHDQEALRLLSSHPNIIRTSDFFSFDSDKFVLPHEYFERGRTLEDLLENVGTAEETALTWRDKRFVVESIAKGLGHCHKSGIIHRDVKPHSIVVVPPGDGCRNLGGQSQSDDELFVKLVNFDLARIKGGPREAILADAKERLDPSCTAPEVLNDPLVASAASDVFSLGLIFYRLITNNHKPFQHIEEAINGKKVALDIPCLVAELSFMRKPENIIRTLQQMVEIDPKKRHQTMDQVVHELRLADESKFGDSERIASQRRLAQLCEDLLEESWDIA